MTVAETLAGIIVVSVADLILTLVNQDLNLAQQLKAIRKVNHPEIKVEAIIIVVVEVAVTLQAKEVTGAVGAVVVALITR